mgnify:CR=1 FL=1
MPADALLRQSDEFVASRPHLFRLGSEVVAAVWEEPARVAAGRPVAKLDGRAVSAPVCMLAVPTLWGGVRRLVLVRWRDMSSDGSTFSIHDADGRTILEFRAGARRLEQLDAAGLLGGLDANGRARVVRQIVEVARSAFSLQGDLVFCESCRRLVQELVPQPPSLIARVHLTSRLVLCEGSLPAGFGRLLSAAVIGPSWVRAASFEPMATGPARNGRTPIHMVVERAVATEGTIIVLFGEGGLACRSVGSSDASSRPFLEWLERRRVVPHTVREYVAACLARAHQDPDAAAVLREMQALVPMGRRRADGAGRPIAADIEHAIAAGEGVFFSGWIRDPHQLIEKIVVVSPLGTKHTVPLPGYRFPREDVEKRFRGDFNANTDRLPGFIGFTPGFADASYTLQYRFELLLRSGTKIDIVPPPQPASLVDRRAAVLGSVPAPYVTSSMLAECIAPAVGPLHRAYMETCGEAEPVAFGRPPEKPDISVIVPLYRNLDFIRFQMAAFAVDPDFRRAELIYVLDSPEQRLQVEHLLLGLHGLYGIPVRLAVMPGNYGYAAANNRAARLAGGEYLVLLNSDVVPDRPGWLSAMEAEFQTAADVGIVGAKLLFEDGALQHAGMYFGRDLRGEWLNQHYYKGFPRDFAPANVARSVPAVTGACLMIQRALFEKVGRFSEEFVIGDYEDSDLCLKVRQAGHDIRYTPAAELYHFERRSISRHGGYMRSVAGEYNRWLHARRWADVMDAVMASMNETAPATPLPDPPQRRKVGAGR